jgi:plasmid stabilization system protein ParE
VATRRRQVSWTQAARRHIDEAIAIAAEDAPAAAERLLSAALDAAASLDTLAERGRIVPELGLANVREILVGRYRLIYEVGEGEVTILAFVHGARDLRRVRLTAEPG